MFPTVTASARAGKTRRALALGPRTADHRAMAKPAKAKAKTRVHAATKANPKAKARAATKANPSARAKPTPRPNAKRHAAKAETPASHGRFDRAGYDLPVMDLAEAIALATALLAARPAKAAPAVVEEGKRVAAARDRARAVQGKQDGRSASVDARAYDVAMDRAWATFVRRIQDHVELPPARRTHAADVARIYGIVSDLSILKLNYLAEFAQIGARLDSLKREGLLEVARELAGAAFVDEVLRCHGEYGQALGLMPAASTTADVVVDRGEARLALVEAIAEYTVQVMAQARAGRSESWAPVAKALGPIAELRARQQRAHRAPPAPPPRAPHPPVERPPSPELGPQPT
jgi:hypothetical protein